MTPIQYRDPSGGCNKLPRNHIGDGIHTVNTVYSFDVSVVVGSAVDVVDKAVTCLILHPFDSGDVEPVVTAESNQLSHKFIVCGDIFAVRKQRRRMFAFQDLIGPAGV